jgi:FkbM family methyltransferase
MAARGDIDNNISSNGELMVQRCVVDAWKLTHDPEKRLVVFDVGANVGDWSEPLLSYIASSFHNAVSDLHMFEPVPDTLAILQGRLLNTSKGATLHYHQVALSSAKGSEAIYLLGASGINSLHPDKITAKSPSIQIVKDTISSFCTTNEIQKIHLLKCDTEGHDMEVIQGALPLLKQNRISVLQFEYNHRWIYSRHYLKDVFDTTAELPYKLGKVRADHIELYNEWHPELERFFEANYILIHHDALRWFPTRETFFDIHNTLSTKRS